MNTEGMRNWTLGDKRGKSRDMGGLHISCQPQVAHPMIQVYIYSNNDNIEQTHISVYIGLE